MNAYYRSRDGVVDGPYFEGQLISMYKAGQLVVTDMLCLQGCEDWLPRDAVLDGVVAGAVEMKAPLPKAAVAKKAGKRKRRGDSLLGLAVFGVATILGLALFWPVGLVMLVVLLAGALCRGWVCGDCGNKVEKTSTQCPACRATLTR